MIIIKTNGIFFGNNNIHIGMNPRKLYKIQFRINKLFRNIKNGKYKIPLTIGDKFKGE